MSLKKCSRCGGQVLTDLACLQCGADFRPIQAYEWYRDQTADTLVRPDLSGLFKHDRVRPPRKRPLGKTLPVLYNGKV